MFMSKYILTNDLHLSLRNPSSRIDNYHEAIFGKLDQIYRLAVKIQASAILLAGDIFNEKTRVPISLVFEVWRWCIKVKQAGIRILSIPGNHDLQNDRYDSLSGQALGLLYLGGAMEDVSFKIVDVDGVDIGGIPYPAAKVMASYDSMPPPRGHRSILMSHCFALPMAGEYFGEPILAYSDMLSYPFGVYHFGHDHRDNGVHRIGDRWFVNIGALSRGALSHENIGRDVKCAIVEFGDSGTSVLQVKLQYRPASEVFDLTLRAQKERERSDIEQFVAGLSQDLADISPVNFKEKLQAMEIPDQVRVRVLTYIDQAEAPAA
jgi:DNA repair exonuclease SbcCD nuclease subunit